MEMAAIRVPFLLTFSLYLLYCVGPFWLLAGFANEDSVLYGDELQAARAVNPNFRLDIALSLQQKNKAGGPAYVQVGWLEFEYVCVIVFRACFG